MSNYSVGTNDTSWHEHRFRLALTLPSLEWPSAPKYSSGELKGEHQCAMFKILITSITNMPTFRFPAGVCGAYNTWKKIQILFHNILSLERLHIRQELRAQSFSLSIFKCCSLGFEQWHPNPSRALKTTNLDHDSDPRRHDINKYYTKSSPRASSPTAFAVLGSQNYSSWSWRPTALRP